MSAPRRTVFAAVNKDGGVASAGSAGRAPGVKQEQEMGSNPKLSSINKTR